MDFEENLGWDIDDNAADTGEGEDNEESENEDTESEDDGEEAKGQSNKPRGKTQDKKVDDDDQEDNDKSGKSESKPRSNDNDIKERAKITKELLGLDKNEDVIIGKDGKLKLVMPINGTKRVIPLEELRKGFNLNQAGQEKLEEGKKAISNLKNFLDTTKQKPEKVWNLVDKLGIDKYELAHNLLKGRVDELEMTPEEKRIKDLEEKERLYEEEKKNREKTEQERLNEGKVKAESNRAGRALGDAMVKFGFGSKSITEKSEILNLAIGKLMTANNAGEYLSEEDAVYLAKEQWQNSTIAVFDDISDDQILSSLPAPFVKRLRKAIAKEARTTPPTSNSDDQTLRFDKQRNEVTTPKRRKRETKFVSNFFENLGT